MFTLFQVEELTRIHISWLDVASSRLHSYRFISFCFDCFLMKNSRRLDSLALLVFNVYLKLKSCFVNTLILFISFVRFYPAGTFYARLCARLLMCFGRPVGWKQSVKLHLIKLMRLICSNDSGYA